MSDPDEVQAVFLSRDERNTLVFALGTMMGTMYREDMHQTKQERADFVNRHLRLANKLGCTYAVDEPTPPSPAG